MMMFTRLKNQSIETILLLATFNLVAVGLIAIKASRVSPEILGFSIAAAIAAGAAIVMLAFKLGDPLARLARQASEWTTPETEEDRADQRRHDTIGQLARGIAGLKGAIRETETDCSPSRAQLDEAMRRLSNGDATTLLQQPFPEALEGLRVRFNRLTSMLNLNLSVVRRAVLVVREQARASQGDLAVIGERLVNARPTMHKALSSIEVMQRATRMRGEDARLVSRSAEDGRQASQRLGRAAGEAHEAAEAATAAFEALNTLVARIGDLAIRAESIASSLEQRRKGMAPAPHPSADAVRQLAGECTETARGLMLQCRQMDNHMSEARHALTRILREADGVGEALTDMTEPAERLSHNVDLEGQRLSQAHAAVSETEAVLQRSHEIVEATEASLVRMMGEAAIVETRLSLFVLSAPDEPARRSTGLRPSLRCVT